MAKDTIDETYYWIGKRKMTAAKSMGEKMTQTLQKNNSQKKGLQKGAPVSRITLMFRTPSVHPE